MLEKKYNIVAPPPVKYLLCRNLCDICLRLEGMDLEDSAMRRRKTKVRMKRKKRVEVRVMVRPKWIEGRGLEGSLHVPRCRLCIQWTCTGIWR